MIFGYGLIRKQGCLFGEEQHISSNNLHGIAKGSAHAVNKRIQRNHQSNCCQRISVSYTHLVGCARSEGETALVSINVGKADCHLLYVGESLYMIDTGAAESWGMVSRALTILGIKHLDGVILTHTDKDHAGGIQALASSSVAVDAWYSSRYYTDVKESKHPAVLAAAMRGEEVVWLQAGDTLPVADGTLRVLGPVRMDCLLYTSRCV